MTPSIGSRVTSHWGSAAHSTFDCNPVKGLPKLQTDIIEQQRVYCHYT